MHHIFPKAQLYKRKHTRPEVNALANFCFLTKDTNLDISDRLPEEYFPEVEAAHPGALASQWIPADKALWKIENFRDFLEARKVLLAAELNRRMEELLHGDTRWLAGPASAAPSAVSVGGGITSDEEEAELEALNDWVESQGLPRGVVRLRLRRSAIWRAEGGVRPGVAERTSGGTEPAGGGPAQRGCCDTQARQPGAGFRCFTDAAVLQALR